MSRLRSSNGGGGSGKEDKTKPELGEHRLGRDGVDDEEKSISRRVEDTLEGNNIVHLFWCCYVTTVNDAS